MKRSTFITWDQLKVGALILAAIGILAIAIYKLGQAANLFTKRYKLVTFLSNSNGLQKGGSVTSPVSSPATSSESTSCRRPATRRAICA